MRISVPKESGIETWHTPLNVLFALPGEKASVTVSCRPNRARSVNGNIVDVGVSFADCDFPNYHSVQN